jgi:hypothetical protein
MILLTFRTLAAPLEHWKPADALRPPSPFSASYRDTLRLLDSELGHLRPRDVFLQVVAPPSAVRIDGQLRADARVEHPGASLTIDSAHLGTLVYETDRFGPRWRGGRAWHENLRAIALGLRALRTVERYGIARRGEQYAGYRALPPGTPLGTTMGPGEAAAILVDACGWEDLHPDDLLSDPSILADVYREASKRTHPDNGGDPAVFDQVVRARAVLAARERS